MRLPRLGRSARERRFVARASGRISLIGLLACFALGIAAAPAAASTSVQQVHFTWRMASTYGSARDRNGLPRSTPPTDIPSGPGRVDLELLDHCEPDATYRWSVDGAAIQPQRDGCVFATDAFRTLGSYDVGVQGTVDGQRAEGSERIDLEQLLIVSIGDSVASGEGVPERRNPVLAGWANARCHRSAYAAPALATRELAKRRPRVAVIFVDLSCSGASIANGLLGPYRGIGLFHGGVKLSPQVHEVESLPRTPSVILVSAGANDVGFGAVVKRCLSRLLSSSCFSGRLGRQVARSLQELPARLLRLHERLDTIGAPVYQTEYFDPTGGERGSCPQILKPRIPGLRRLGLSQVDLEDARSKLLEPLNTLIAQSIPGDSHWIEITGIAAAFRSHGYCAEDAQRWITTLGESFLGQGAGVDFGARVAGTLHPNREGHRQIANRIEAVLNTLACSRPRGRATPATSPSVASLRTDPPACAPRRVDEPLMTAGIIAGVGVTAILWSWATSAALLLALAAGLGLVVNVSGAGDPPTRSVLGILIDNRGRFSLNRLQLVLWSIVVISLVSGLFFGRLIEGVASPLGFTIPDNVLGLLGISLGGGVLTGAAKATKKAKAEGDAVASAAPGKAASRLATSEATGRPPFLGQVFMLEEGDYADDVVDVTKFQAFGFTVVLVVAYVAMAIHAIVDAHSAAAVTALPNLSGTFVALLGASYAGYIAGKLPTRTGAPRRRVPAASKAHPDAPAPVRKGT